MLKVLFDPFFVLVAVTLTQWQLQVRRILIEWHNHKTGTVCFSGPPGKRGKRGRRGEIGKFSVFVFLASDSFCENVSC